MSGTLAHYTLGELLGAGGMGRVFAAEHPSGKPLAVKVLHETLRADPMLVARLADEARTASLIQHRNVIRVLDHGLDDGAPFLVMERAHGIPLGSLIEQQGPLPLVRARAIASQILSGLAAIHRAGLVHGDMKSDNVLVDAADRVTIIDFGLARSQGARPEWLDEHMLSGTPEYMAPELVMGRPITVAAEIYAVGVIVYEMVTGSTPFGGGTTTAIFERHLTDDVVPPSLRCPDRTIPVPLENVIMRALAKEPSSRHLNAEMFATAVERSIAPRYIERRVSHAVVTDCPATGPTREWTRRTTQRRLPHPRRRFAEGTAPRDSAEVIAKRDELGDAFAAGSPDAIIATTLALVQILLDEHRLAAAAHQLDEVIGALDAQSPAQLWRLELALGAVYEGLGYHDRAREAGQRAGRCAERAGDRAGINRAAAFIRRLPSRSR